MSQDATSITADRQTVPKYLSETALALALLYNGKKPCKVRVEHAVKGSVAGINVHGDGSL